MKALKSIIGEAMHPFPRRPEKLLLALAPAALLAASLFGALVAACPEARAQAAPGADSTEVDWTQTMPRKLNDWRLRCATDRDEIVDALAPAQGSRMFSDLDHASAACRILAGSGGPCALARAELLATLLNVGAGRVPAAICVQAGDDVKPLSEIVDSADTWLFQGCTSERCERISSGLRGVNDGTRLVACGEGTQVKPVPGAPEPRVAPALAPAPVPHATPALEPTAPPGDDPGAANPAFLDSGAALPAAGTCCDPRDARAWQRACTLSGKWTTLTTLLDNDNLRDFAMSTCAALALPDIDPHEESRRQLVALRLNVRSGYLSPTCPLAGGETVEEAARRAFLARRGGRPVEARDIATGINEGTSLLSRSPCAKPAEGQDLIWEPPPPVVEAPPEPEPPPRQSPPPSGKKRRR